MANEIDTEGRAAERWPSTGVGAPRAVATVRAEPAMKRALATVGFLLDTPRKRRSGRIVIWALVAALAVSGIYMLSYPIITDVWANRLQQNLQTDFNELSGGFSARPKVGSPLTRLTIPRLGVKIIVVEGTTGNALRAGAGHFYGTALPGSSTGNVAIAGHRTGFGEPFRHVDRLRTGDEIDLYTPFGRYIYKVMPAFDGHPNPWVTDPSDYSVLNATADPELTLITCDPPHTSLRRLIVRARLVRSLPNP